MALYDYKREDGSVFEEKQSMHDKPLTHCPETGQKCTRIITTVPMVGFSDPFMHTNWCVDGKDKSATWAESAGDKVNV
jgi:putative FmdB family regulatory protein